MDALQDRRWAVTSAAVGAAAWFVAPFVPAVVAPRLGSIEHVFLLFPLVAAPLAILLLATFTSAPLLRLALRAQPAAATLVLVSFFVAKGRVAGLLSLPWLLLALAIAAAGIPMVKRGTGPNLSNVSLLAAHFFLPVGAIWLLLSRLGAGPRHFSEVTVLLAAVHFHFSGFTLQLLVGSTGRVLEPCAPWLRALHRAVAVGTIAALALIAAGNALASPALKVVGVAAMALGASALAISTAGAASAARSPAARALLLASSASIASAMILAGVHGAGEAAGAPWIGIARMTHVHGLLGGLGFALCGLVGHLATFARHQTCPSSGPEDQPSRRPPAPSMPCDSTNVLREE